MLISPTQTPIIENSQAAHCRSKCFGAGRLYAITMLVIGIISLSIAIGFTIASAVLSLPLLLIGSGISLVAAFASLSSYFCRCTTTQARTNQWAFNRENYHPYVPTEGYSDAFFQPPIYVERSEARDKY